MGQARIGRDGAQVLLSLDGRTTTLSYQSAIEVGRALLKMARQAESEAGVERLIADQALVLKLGLPIGLTRHPDVQAEAMKTALYDRDLRRYLGTESPQGVVGTPTIINHGEEKR